MVATAAEVSLGSTLTERQAREIYTQGEEAVVFALLQLAQQLAAQSASVAGTSHDTPATPSEKSRNLRHYKRPIFWCGTTAMIGRVSLRAIIAVIDMLV